MSAGAGVHDHSGKDIGHIVLVLCGEGIGSHDGVYPSVKFRYSLWEGSRKKTQDLIEKPDNFFVKTLHESRMTHVKRVCN